MARVRLAAALLLVLACDRPSGTGDTGRDTAVAGADAAAALPSAVWTVRSLQNVPERFRPYTWTSEVDLWGLVRGRITRVDIATGATQTLPQEAWSLVGGPGVLSWRNAEGTWVMRDGAEPRLLPFGADSVTGFEGPLLALWSPDGMRALLRWEGEWDSVFELLHSDGTRRRLDVGIRGYYGKDAALWLDRERILFHVTATGPRGGEPEYRESGWGGDLAVLDLQTGKFESVTAVPDLQRLRVAGRLGSDILVTVWDTAGVRGHRVYDATWRAQPVNIPPGRAFASPGGAVVLLTDTAADSTPAVLIAGGRQTPLGMVARDAQPVFTPSGNRAVLLTASGLVMLERQP